jgi:hypothetical protein
MVLISLVAVSMAAQVIKSICEVRKSADSTQEMWKPLEDLVQVRTRMTSTYPYT